MTRTLFARVPALALLFFLNASFSAPPEHPALRAAVKSHLRVTRHFAAGLEYLLLEPRDAAPDAELPMIVVLHGRGAQPVPPRHAYLGLDVPVRIVMPRGPLRQGDGYAWMPVSAHHGDSEALSGALRARVNQLATAMLEWRHRYPTRGLPIVTGFSQGGIVTAALSMSHPESMSRAFVMAGWLPTSMEPTSYDPYASHVPLHALHGANDRVIGAARTRRQLSRLRAMGFPVIYESIPHTAHERSPEMVDRLRELVGAALADMPQTSATSGQS